MFLIKQINSKIYCTMQKGKKNEQFSCLFIHFHTVLVHVLVNEHVHEKTNNLDL